MLLNMILEIIVNGGTSHNAVLYPPVHHLLVNIKTRGFLLQAYPLLNHLPQILRSFLIYLLIININGSLQVDFRFVHMQK